MFKNNSSVVKKTVAYTYDVFDRRIGKSVDNDGPGAQAPVVSKYVYDGDQIALVFDGAGAMQRRRLYGPAVDQILADEKLSAGLWWDFGRFLLPDCALLPPIAPWWQDGQEIIPDRARTCNLRLRRPTLYPIGLRGLVDRARVGSLLPTRPMRSAGAAYHAAVGF